MAKHLCKRGLNGLPCGNVRLGQPYDITRDCRVCWLFAHDKRYNLAWSGDGNVTPLPIGAIDGTPRIAPVPKPQRHRFRLGDTVAKTLRFFGIKGWKGCQCNRRKAKLNAWSDAWLDRLGQLPSLIRRWPWRRSKPAPDGKPKLLIGMAVYDDFDGVYFTIQALRLFHAEAMAECEIAVIDNNPSSMAGKRVKEFLGWVRDDVAAVHYVPFPEPVGTAAPRNHLFTVGTAPAVVCVDPHVLLALGSVRKLIDWCDAHPDANDLFQGPLVYDNLISYSTHFADVWGSDCMWGTWATDARGENPDGKPFEISAQGLGLFTCRREAWMGFNPRFRGFGGEEWYIHEKFRKAGRKVMCLPFLRWVHRFSRPAGIQYPLSLEDKCRNYILGLSELGIPLDRAKKSFVGSGKLPEREWDRILANAAH